MDTYTNANNPDKEICRYKVLNHFRDESLLSLPWKEFKLESQFRDLYKKSFIETVELKPEIYKEGLQLAKNLNINHYNDDIFNHIIKSNVKYENIWLDLCGYLTPQLINKLISISQGHYTTKESKIALTLMAAREQFGHMGFSYGFKDLKQFREQGLIDLLSKFAKMNNVKLKYDDLFSYKSNNGVPMNLYLLTLKTK